MKLNLAHIVNPYSSPEGSEHFVAQPITLHSILVAKQYKTELYNLELFAAIYKGDEHLVPQEFKIVYLQQSLKDVADFKNARPLPLMADILNTLIASSNADYFIYTNIDIGLQPHFYSFVCDYIGKGYEALVINRRGIPENFNSIEQLPEMYKQKGASHPGYDCFVFKKEVSRKLIFKNICIGIPRFERVFILNLICFVNTIVFLEDVFLTFHIGQTIYKSWGDKNHLQHNQKEYKKIRKELFSQLNITKFPYWNNFIILRYWKWLWNPNFSLPDNLLLEWRYRFLGR